MLHILPPLLTRKTRQRAGHKNTKYVTANAQMQPFDMVCAIKVENPIFANPKQLDVCYVTTHYTSLQTRPTVA